MCSHCKKKEGLPSLLACSTDEDGAEIDVEGLGEAGHAVTAEELVLEAGSEAVAGEVPYLHGALVQSHCMPFLW